MRIVLKLLATTLIGFSSLDARIFPVPARQPSDPQAIETTSADHFQAGIDAMRAKRWDVACREFEAVRQGDTSFPHFSEALFQLGLAYYEKGALCDANNRFTEYLNREATPRHFIDVFNLKCRIADQWHHGTRKNLFNLSTLPCWQGARGDALKLYEEIFTALPSHDLGARALFGRAELAATLKDFGESVERYQAFLTRFSKHVLAPESFLRIAEVYLEEAKEQPHDPDLLPLAELNVRKFRQEFPTDARLIEAERLLDEMRDVFAEALFNTGRFFERTQQKDSALVYYQAILRDFPRAQIAQASADRLAHLAPAQAESP
jgi:outer membrane protein assembly factor BamD (BamD/ComL family)